MPNGAEVSHLSLHVKTQLEIISTTHKWECFEKCIVSWQLLGPLLCMMMWLIICVLRIRHVVIRDKECIYLFIENVDWMFHELSRGTYE